MRVDACLVAAAGIVRRRIRKKDDDDVDGRMQVERREETEGSYRACFKSTQIIMMSYKCH